MSEDVLLKSIAGGDQCAFEELYRCYYQRLKRFLAKRIPSSHSADEIIDDTLMIVWQHANRFHRRSQVSTWIFGIAYHVALKSLRTNKRWRRMSFANGQPEPVFDPIREDEQREWLREGMRRLPRNQRLSILLTYQLGHTVEQVAAMTQCAVGTVKARMFHARGNLRDHLTALQ